MDASQISIITKNIQQAKKYQHLSLETIERIVQWAAARYKSKEVEKQAKKKLHQVFGAYFSAGEKMGLGRKIREAGGERRERGGTRIDEQGVTNEEVRRSQRKKFFLDAMQLHASSRERGAMMEDFYKRIFEVAERPANLIDLACGLNPFSCQWLAEVAPDTAYHGFDIDLDTTAQMDQFLQNEGFPVRVGYNDLFISVPPHEAGDTVMLLKTLPCLEQQEKGISKRLLSQLTCDQVIISFPAKSLGGKEKGMVESYRAFLEGLVEGSGYEVKGVVAFESETVYILNKD